MALDATLQNAVLGSFFTFSLMQNLGEKALCSGMWHPGIILFTGLKHLPHFSWTKPRSLLRSFSPINNLAMSEHRWALRVLGGLAQPWELAGKEPEPCTQHWGSVSVPDLWQVFRAGIAAGSWCTTGSLCSASLRGRFGAELSHRGRDTPLELT